MRIVFMGTPGFAVPTLDAIVAAGHEVVGVVAQPDRPKGRGRKLVSPPTVNRARELGLEVKQPRAVKRGPFPEWFEQVGADVAVVVAYGRILTPRLLAGPKRGCINVHGSLLPKYRGAAPIQWAIVRGEAETGVCTMWMDEGMDTGDVLLERRTQIGDDETAGELAERLAPMGAALLVETLENLDEIAPRPQDHDAATMAPLLGSDDGRIDWSEPAQRIHDRVRGLNPWPRAWSGFRDVRIKIHQTRVVEGAGEPGTVIEASARAVVATGEGAVELCQVQLPGKPARTGRDFVNGSRLEIGEVLRSDLETSR